MSGTGSFRSDVRAWLEANCPASQRGTTTRADQYWGGRDAVFPSDHELRVG